jgi:Xaa-Pro aminopeptidase
MMKNGNYLRQKDLRVKMAGEGVDALIITKVANVSYITGFKGDDSWAVVTPKRTYLLTDSRFTEQAQKECDCEVIERKEGLAKTAAEILGDQKRISTVAVEDCTPVNVFSMIKKQAARIGKIQKSSELVEGLREIKDRTEVLAIKRAAQVAVAAMGETIGEIRPGMTEGEVAGLLNLNMRKRGHRESFETIVAFGPNASRPHHLSAGRKLKKNDTILIDWGAKVGLYCSDLTRCFGVGRTSTEYRRVYEAVLEAQQAAIMAGRHW